MTTQKFAKVFGVILLLVGVLGFVPGVTTSSGYLLGIFRVDAIHNIIHILTGIVALMSAGSMHGAKTFFKIFGIVYAIITIVGFLQGTTVLGLISVNTADNLLHLLITIVSLIAGFGGSKSSMTTA